VDVRAIANVMRRFPTSAGVPFGLGLGGFFECIMLHQVLEWNQLFSSVPTETLQAFASAHSGMIFFTPVLTSSFSAVALYFGVAHTSRAGAGQAGYWRDRC